MKSWMLLKLNENKIPNILRDKTKRFLYILFGYSDSVVQQSRGINESSGEASPTFGHAMQIFMCSWTEKTINF